MARAREGQHEALARWEALKAIQQTFPFTAKGLLMFAEMVIHELIPGNPHLNRMQADILKFLFYGNRLRLIEAPRGIAKTTLSAIYTAFRLIHTPHLRIMVVSQNAKRAKDIAGWVLKIFNGLDILECMLPDIYAGDRASIEAFEVHHSLRGMGNKDPSVACYSIEGGLQGARADIILGDDVESLQNARTAAGRELLEDLTKEFESINQFGDIIYLGTPQNINSIYNNLPARGYQCRIWTARYMSEEAQLCYGDFLAPMLVQDMKDDPSLRTGYGLDGSSGAPCEPAMYPEEVLVEKEIAQGASKFQLQFMLNTRMLDADRYPLKLNDLMFTDFSIHEVPQLPVWSNDSLYLLKNAPKYGNKSSDFLYAPVSRPYEWTKVTRKIMYIDASGRGSDETGVAIVFLAGTFIYVWKCFGVQGGYSPQVMQRIVQEAKAAEVNEVFVEKNFGDGMFASIIKPYFEREWPVTIEEDWASGQKELRIIDTLEPLLNTHRLVFHSSIAKSDYDSVQHYPVEQRNAYSLLNQISNITRDKKCLRHDDRLDSLAGAIRQLTSQIDYDEVARIERLRRAEARDYLAAMHNANQRRAMLYGESDAPVRKSNVLDAWQQRTVGGQNFRKRSTNTLTSRMNRMFR